MNGVFTGGRTLMLASALAGAGAVGLTAFGFTRGPTIAATSVLLAFVYWTGVAMASLLLVAAFNAAGAKWITLVRRQLEHHAAALVVCGVAFAGLVFAARHLYPAMDERGFIAHGAVVLALYAVVWWVLDRGSVVQAGKAPDPALRGRARALSSAALLFLALAMTAAAFDWLMALEPGFRSSVFALYWFAGSALCAAALLLLAVVVPVDPNLAAARASNEHVAGLAALMLALTALWAFAAYAQSFIVTQAALPAELPWVAARGGPWAPIAMLLWIGRAGMPALTLAWPRLRRHRKFLTALCVWTLTMQFVDLFWVIKPALRLRGELFALPEATFGWTDVTAWIGLGALCVAFVLFRMRGRHAVPLNDPALEESLQYRSS